MRQFTKKIHMVGIGGAGMCPLAEVLLSHGHIVTGSDRARSAASSRLESIGIQVQYNHIPEHVKATDLLVYSSAVKEDNPERVFARENNIPCIRRAELLGDLMRANFTICISGTHGKTTTTSLIGTIFHEAALQPTVLVGGMVRSAESHAFIGKSNIMVAEADEYDRSFLAMYPTIAVITNIEADHLDCYGNLQNIKDAFIEFTERIPFYGAVVVCIDDSGVRDVLNSIRRTVVTYGIEKEADYRAISVEFSTGKPTFTILKKGVVLGSVTLNVPGKHNILNALASIAVATEMGIEFKSIAASLARFQGVRRRFEVVGKVNGITVIDDYAHHPGEIRATLDAARSSGFSRVIAVFQPHLYSRTRDFMADFAESLGRADVIYIADIYKAREEPIPGVSSETIVKNISASGHRNVHYVPQKNEIIPLIAESAKNGDAVVIMGAGDIWEIAPGILEKITNG
jgi:UDP-N-acetylmuramate--alanine ligase